MQRALTAADVVDAPQIADLHLSPDGRHVAYVLRTGSRSTIWVDGLRFTTGPSQDDQPRWSPDGRTLAFRSDRAGRPQVYLVPLGGGEAQALTADPAGVEAFAWSPRGDRIAYTSADPGEAPDPWLAGAAGGHHRLRTVAVADGRVTTLYAGEGHVGAFAWSPDGEALAFVRRSSPEPEAALGPAAILTTTGRELARLPAAPGAMRWLRAGIFYTATVAMGPCSSACLYRLEGGVRVLGGDDRCLGALCGGGPDELAVTLAHGLTSVLGRFDPWRGEFSPIFAPEGGDLGSADVAGEHWAAVVSYGDRPAEVYRDGSRVSAHGLQGFTWGRQEPFHWQGRDGLALDGVFIHPVGATTNPPPAVCLLHGGPYGRYTLGFQLSWGQWLATAGYAVLMPNYRGGAGHGEAFAAAARGRVGHEDWEDVAAAVEAAVGRGLVDPHRLAVGGWSQGGFLAACAVTRSQRFRAAVVGAGVSDWHAMVMNSDLPTFEAALGGGTPWDGSGAPTAYSPIREALRARTPTLILHGRKDPRVPVNQAIGFYRALRAAGCPCELVLYPREAHAIRERAHQIDVLERVRDWFARWLG